MKILRTLMCHRHVCEEDLVLCIISRRGGPTKSHYMHAYAYIHTYMSTVFFLGHLVFTKVQICMYVCMYVCRQQPHHLVFICVHNAGNW